MTLDRGSVTVASRIMFPTYLALFGFLGMNYTFNARERLLESPSLRFANEQMPLPAWGCMFFVCAILMAWALLADDRRARAVFGYALWLGLICLTIWAAVFFAAAIFADASPTSWCWPAFAATACYASHRSLLSREV